MTRHYHLIADTKIQRGFAHDAIGEFAAFAKGYRISAERIARSVIGSSHSTDYDAYPAVFLYRHALELSLKQIIYASATLADYLDLAGLEHKFHNSHDLVRLGTVANKALSLIAPQDNLVVKALPLIEKACSYLNKIDPDSFMYRYPIDTRGNPPSEIQTIDLVEFSKQMSTMLKLLETIHVGIDGETYSAQEGLSEALSYYGSADW